MNVRILRIIDLSCCIIVFRTIGNNGWIGRGLGFFGLVFVMQLSRRFIRLILSLLCHIVGFIILFTFAIETLQAGA